MGDLVEKVGDREFHRSMQETGLQDRELNQNRCTRRVVLQTVNDCITLIARLCAIRLLVLGLGRSQSGLEHGHEQAATDHKEPSRGNQLQPVGGNDR